MKNMIELTGLAFAIRGPIKRYWPTSNELGTFTPSYAFEGYYNINNGVIAFQSEQVLYVIPWMEEVINILRSNAFAENIYLYVPFSNGDIPVDGSWECLREIAFNRKQAKFLKDCEQFFEERQIGSLEDSLLRKCLIMPLSGIKVQAKSPQATTSEFFYYPVILGPTDLTNHMKEYSLGHYHICNGVCAFVYKDGNTYVTRCPEVMKKLVEVGFLEGTFTVPFAKNEIILNPFYQKEWEKTI